MKDYWFKFIEQKDREAQYYQTQALTIAGDVSNIQDGFKKLREAMDKYHGALFPWMPDPSVKKRLEYESVVVQLDSELDYLKKNHRFEISDDKGTMRVKIPEYMHER
jgi:hypothetical protein